MRQCGEEECFVIMIVILLFCSGPSVSHLLSCVEILSTDKPNLLGIAEQSPQETSLYLIDIEKDCPLNC